MKVLIVYYSKTGNTEKISGAIEEYLEPICEVEMLKIEMVKEYSYVLPHLNPRILFDIVLYRKPRIETVIDMSPYDLVCVGTPNWYGRIAPPVNTFIEKATGVEGKKAVAFVSSGFGKESYGDDLAKRLEKKGLRVIKTLSLTLRDISESQLKEIRKNLT